MLYVFKDASVKFLSMRLIQVQELEQRCSFKDRNSGEF
jgi:hypothetical protein